MEANIQRSPSNSSTFYTNGHGANGAPTRPVAPAVLNVNDALTAGDMVLELADGSAYSGISFGAPGKSVAGECVFQTGKPSAEREGSPRKLHRIRSNILSSCLQAWLATLNR